jgi:hypothetical protein
MICPVGNARTPRFMNVTNIGTVPSATYRAQGLSFLMNHLGLAVAVFDSFSILVALESYGAQEQTQQSGFHQGNPSSAKVLDGTHTQSSGRRKPITAAA